MITDADTELWQILCDHLDRARRGTETRVEVLSRLLEPAPQRHLCVTCEEEVDAAGVLTHRAQGHDIWPDE